MAAARRSRAEWEQLVREAERVGSVEEVARRHGIRRATLAWWRWQLRHGTVARSATNRSPVQLVPVRVRAEPRRGHDLIALGVDDGHVTRVLVAHEDPRTGLARMDALTPSLHPGGRPQGVPISFDGASQRADDARERA